MEAVQVQALTGVNQVGIGQVVGPSHGLRQTQGLVVGHVDATRRHLIAHDARQGLPWFDSGIPWRHTTFRRECARGGGHGRRLRRRHGTRESRCRTRERLRPHGQRWLAVDIGGVHLGLKGRVESHGGSD